MIAQPVVAADVEDVAAVRVTGDRLELDLVQPVSDTDGQDVHSLRLQNQNQDLFYFTQAVAVQTTFYSVFVPENNI